MQEKSLSKNQRENRNEHLTTTVKECKYTTVKVMRDKIQI